ncbi:MAG: hypothetical protein HUJ89_05310 [Bacteroidales bacterium]|nr:hypothetical protein [Bacteroidales bacterium]
MENCEEKDKKPRLCPVCKQVIVGRSDKNFCSEACRNMYHNRKYSRLRHDFKAIDRILKRNYLILKSLINSGTRKTNIHDMVMMGYIPKYVTSIRQENKHNKILAFSESPLIYECYDICFRQNKWGEVEILGQRPLPVGTILALNNENIPDDGV